MAKNNNLKDYLIDLYQGIASRKPNASKNPQDFRSEIENLVFTSDANAAAADIRAGKTAYVNDVKITGTIKDYDNTYEDGRVPTDMLQIKIDNNNSCAYLFYQYTGTSDDFIASFSQLDTSKVTDMRNMFCACTNLTTIPQFNTSSCTRMESMFYNCPNLITIPQLDTSSCTNMVRMFQKCPKLTTIDITHMNNRTIFSNYLAADCYSLRKFIIRNMDTIPELGSYAFENCYHFRGTTNATYNPDGLKDGRIYVPDDKVEELKVTTNWESYASIIVPLSTLEE